MRRSGLLQGLTVGRHGGRIGEGSLGSAEGRKRLRLEGRLTERVGQGGTLGKVVQGSSGVTPAHAQPSQTHAKPGLCESIVAECRQLQSLFPERNGLRNLTRLRCKDGEQIE